MWASFKEKYFSLLPPIIFAVAGIWVVGQGLFTRLQIIELIQPHINDISIEMRVIVGVYILINIAYFVVFWGISQWTVIMMGALISTVLACGKIFLAAFFTSIFSWFYSGLPFSYNTKHCANPLILFSILQAILRDIYANGKQRRQQLLAQNNLGTVPGGNIPPGARRFTIS